MQRIRTRLVPALVAATILCAWPFNDAAAVIVSMPLREVYIVNTGNADITFQLRPEDGDWNGDATIASGGDQLFTCGQCAAFEIRIPTDNQITTRTLTSQKRYRIYWNSTEALWDIEEIK